MNVEAGAGLAAPRRYWAAFAVGLAVCVSVLDGVMVLVAAPVIARDLGASPGAVVWVVSAYQLAAAMALLPIGNLADVFGRRRVYLSCLAVFMAGAFVSAAAPSLETLAAARFAQGLGGAGILGVTNAMLRDIYPPDKLARGVGLNSLIVGLALASGPMLASFLLAFANWRLMFLVGAPIGALLLLVGARALPESKRNGESFDLASVPLVALGFGALLGAINLVAHGAARWISLLAGVLGVAGVAALLWRQRGRAAPLLPTDLLRSRAYAAVVATMFAASAAQIMGYIAAPFLMQRDGPRAMLEAGLIFTCWPIAVAAMAPVAGRIARRTPARFVCGAGLALFAAGLALLALTPAHASAWDIAWRLGLCGAGYGLYQPANAIAMLTSVPPARIGSAGSLAAASRVFGQASGAALTAYFFHANLAGGIRAALIAAAIAAAAAAVVSAARD